MKVCFCVTSPETVNAFIKPQLELFKEAGFEIHIITGEGSIDSEVFANVQNVHQILLAREISLLSDLLAVPKIWKHLKRLQPDVVVASTPKMSPIALLSAKLLRVPVRIFQVRGVKWESLSGLSRILVINADRIAALCATKVLAVSKSVAEVMQDQGVVRKRPIVLGLGGSKGVDLGLFTPSSKSLKSADEVVIGFIGRLNPDKGVDLFPLIDEALGERTDVRIEMVGQSDLAQSIRPELLEDIRSSKRIHLIEKRLSHPELVQRIQSWDFLVFPSHREGLPNAVIEAAACCVPTIAWDVTGVRDVVIPNKTGWLVSFGDDKAFVEEVTRIIQGRLFEDVGKQARKFVQENFDLNVVTANLISFLKEEVIQSDK